MKPIKKIIVATMLFAAECAGVQAQDTIRDNDSAFFYGPLNWYNLDTLHQWHSTVNDIFWFNTFYSYSDEFFSYCDGIGAIQSSWYDTAYADHNPFMPSGTGTQQDEVDIKNVFRAFGNTIMGQQMVTDRPIKIIGLAACGRMQRPADTTSWFVTHCTDTYDAWLQLRDSGYYISNTRDWSMEGRITDSLILYKPTPSGTLQKLMGGPWRVEWQHRNIVLPIEDSSLRRYFLYYPTRRPKNDTPLDWDSIPTVALYEVYFDKPVVVEDSFVVAGTAFNNELRYDWVTLPRADNYQIDRMCLWDHCPTRYWNLCRAPQPYEIDYYSTLRGYYLSRTEWDWCEHPKWLKYRNLPWMRIKAYRNARIIFPIIEPDFDTLIEHCRPVENVRVDRSTDSSVTLMWDASNSVRWEVKHGIVGLPEEDYITETTNVPTLTLTGLRPGLQYRAYVRGWCDCDSSYTEWSNRVMFSVEHTEGVPHPGMVGRYTHLLPNPARERVSVLSSYKMSRIEVYALDGRKVLEQEVGGISTVAEVKDLPRGTYIMAVYLPHGVATKKLVLE